eukprot:5263522-Amphidinium_carterae.1
MRKRVSVSVSEIDALVVLVRNQNNKRCCSLTRTKPCELRATAYTYLFDDDAIIFYKSELQDSHVAWGARLGVGCNTAHSPRCTCLAHNCLAAIRAIRAWTVTVSVCCFS